MPGRRRSLRDRSAAIELARMGVRALRLLGVDPRLLAWERELNS